MTRLCLAAAAGSMLALLAAYPALAQPGPVPGGFRGGPPPGPEIETMVIENGPASEGRGGFIPPVGQPVGADAKGLFGYIGPPDPGGLVAAALNGDTPEGIEPLERNIFNSDDFYADRDLWMDPRYYNCMSPHAIEAVWGANNGPLIGDDPPRTAPWGYCDRDYDRANMVSPYPYKTAQEHYEALMAEAKSRGGPTQYDWDNPPPDWNGVYSGNGGFNRTNWFMPRWVQVPTFLSLLTPEYQQRFVQQEWHNAHNQGAYPTQYCMAPGLTRRWFLTQGRVIMNAYTFEFMQGIGEVLGDIMHTTVNIGREFKMDGSVPYIGRDLRSLYGETIGFWDGEVLISWTSNVRGWLNHGSFEFSNQIQTIETYTPIKGQEGNFMGILWDAVLYDPEAFVEPVRLVTALQKTRGPNEGNAFTQVDCAQNLWPIGDTTAVPLSPGDKVEVTVPDIARPWATIWEPFEVNMKKPEAADVLGDFN